MEQEDKTLFRAEKQQYLLENIVEPGYKKEEFAIYIAKERENGGNIDNWSFDELKQVVSEFQDSYTVPLTPEKVEQDSYEEPNSEESPEIAEAKIEENNDIQNVASEEDFEKEYDHINISAEEKENNSELPQNPKLEWEGENEVVKASICDFEDTTNFSDLTAFNKIPDNFIEITDAVHNPGGLFSFSYIEYHIDTQPFGWSVTRKEQDFKRLREYLLKKFPQFVIPPLIQNKLFEIQADKETKKVYFQEFLREVTGNPELCACKYLEEFLSINDYEGFRGVRKMREKEQRGKGLRGYSNVEGKARLTIKWQNIEVLDKYDTFFINKYESHLKSLRESLTLIHINSLNLSDSISQFTTSLSSFSSLFSDWGFDTTLQFYSDLKWLSTAYQESVEQQSKSLIKELELTLSYHMLEANGFRELHKHKEEVNREFHKLGNDLVYKKDQLWDDREKEGTIEKWKLNKEDMRNIEKLLEDEHLAKAKMLPKETQFSWDKNNEFKHLQRRSIEEIERCNKTIGKKLRDKFNTIAKEQLNIINR